MDTVNYQYVDSENFMELISFDVLNYILSFLPPIPHLFFLQRVNKNWKELCQQCMLEDVRVINWTSVLSFHLSDYLHEQKRLQDVVLKHFSNIHTLELCNMVITHDFLKQCEESLPNLQHLSLSVCAFHLQILVTEVKAADSSAEYIQEIGHVNCRGYVPSAFEMGAWKQSLKKITLKTSLFNQVQIFQRPANSTTFEEATLHDQQPSSVTFFFLYSLLLSFPALQDLDFRFVTDSPRWEDSPIADEIIHTSDLLGHGFLPKLLQSRAPHLEFKEAFKEQFPTKFFEDCEVIQQRVQEFTNNFWRDYLAKTFNFSKSRIDTLVYKYYSTTMAEHVHDFELYKTNQIDPLAYPFNIALVQHNYPCSSFSGLVGFPNLSSSYDLGAVAIPLLSFLNSHPYFGIDGDLADESGFNLILHATNFSNVEVLLFLLRYFNEFRLEKRQRLVSKDEAQLARDQKEVDAEFIAILKKRAYTGKTPVQSCFAVSRTLHLFALMLYGANINDAHLNTGATISHDLAQYGQIKTIELIKRHEYRIAEKLLEQENKSNNLGLSIRYNSPSYRLDLNIQDCKGNTPCHAAFLQSMYYTCDELSKLPGVRTNIKNRDGHSVDLLKQRYSTPTPESLIPDTNQQQAVVTTDTTSGLSSFCTIC